jgi:transposase
VINQSALANAHLKITFDGNPWWLSQIYHQIYQHGTGGHVQLHSITKNGDRSLRTLIIHGARAVLRWADKHTHVQSRWLLQLQARQGKNRTVVALANKLTRVAWAVLRTDTDFIHERAFKPVRAA